LQQRLLENKNALGYLFMVPAGVLLLVFLTYPLGLGTWLGFTDAKIGRDGEWIGLENFAFLIGDSVARLSLYNTLIYTVVASVLKFVLGLWLALLLNRSLAFKSFIRAIVLLPFIVPTALSAIAFWWMYDSQFSSISTSTSSATRGTRACRPSPPTYGAACRSWRSRSSPACRRSRPRSTRPRPSTARRHGSSSGTSPCRCSRRSSPS
jgi:ABC-type sugar transport system permease subunit